MNHELGCDCESCMALVQAAIAKNQDGTLFFTDEEMYELSKRQEAESDVA